MLVSTHGIIISSGASFANTLSTSFDGIDEQVDFTQIDLTSAFTTSFWIKPISVGTSRFLAGRNTNSDYIWLRTTSQIRIRINFSTYTFSESGGNDLNLNAWNHLLVVRSSGNSLEIFLNGASFSASQTASGNHRLNQIGGISSNFYEGSVNNAAFWNSDQSANISTIYNAGSPNDISGLSPLLWYRFGNGDTYPTITDNVGTNDGTMQNMSAANFVADVP